MDPSDTVLAYEQGGLDEPFGQNPLVALTSSMDHVQQLEIIYREFPSKRCNHVKRQLINFNQLALCLLPRFQGNDKISHVIFGPVCCWWKGELCEARITEWMDNKENLSMRGQWYHRWTFLSSPPHHLNQRVTVEGAQQFFEELRATKRCRTEPECEWSGRHTCVFECMSWLRCAHFSPAELKSFLLQREWSESLNKCKEDWFF